MSVIVENMPQKDISVHIEEVNCWLYLLNNSVHFSGEDYEGKIAEKKQKESKEKIKRAQEKVWSGN